MAITGITFDNQAVSAKDHGALFAAILADGWLSGCGLSYSGQTLTIAKGFLIACGRLAKLTSAQTVAISRTSGYARVSLKLDMSAAATEENFAQASFAVDYAASPGGFAALTQDDINDTGASYSAEICMLSLNGSGISGINRQWQRASPHIWIPADQRGTSAPATAPEGMAFFVEVS